MKIPNNAIQEFKKLYKNRFNIQISDKEAEQRASNLIGLYEAVYSTDSKSNTMRKDKQYEK